MFMIRRLSYNFSLSKFNAAKDYYKTLGVSTSANEKQIKKAFRQMAKKYHPDANKGNQDKFKQVNQAYQVLGQAAVKKQYDQARTYESNSSSGSYPNQSYNSQQSPGGYQNYNQSYYQKSNQNPSSNYRGYTRPDGWQNQKYREEVMSQIFKQYQREIHNRAQQNRANYGSFEDMYKNHQQNIRHYSQQMKKKQQQIRKAYEAQQIRRQQQFREYQQKQARQFEQKVTQKVNDLKDGIVKNVHGFIKVGQFLKDTWKNVSDTVSNIVKQQKDNKDNKNNKKK